MKAETNWFCSAVTRELAFLFSDFSFELQSCETWGGGMYGMAALQGPECRVKVELDGGVPVIFFGKKDAAFEFGDSTAWLNDSLLLSFMEQKDPAIAAATRNQSGRTAEEILYLRAARLKPYSSEIVGVFGTNGGTDAWWEEFQKFREAKKRAIRAKQ